MDPLGLLSRASRYYDVRLAAVGVDQWSLPSVCDGWTVRDVADHVLGGNRFAVGMLDGLDARAAFDAAVAVGFDGEPLVDYRSSSRAQLAAFDATGALDMIVHHPVGDISARQFLAFRLGDLLLHGWDLARSIGGDDTLDEELVPVVWDAYQPVLAAALEPALLGFGPSSEEPADASLSVQLLVLTGRQP